jgi:hypothetical protein
LGPTGQRGRSQLEEEVAAGGGLVAEKGLGFTRLRDDPKLVYHTPGT